MVRFIRQGEKRRGERRKLRRAAVVRICTGAVKTDRRVMAKRTDGERMRRQDGYEL